MREKLRLDQAEVTQKCTSWVKPEWSKLCSLKNTNGQEGETKFAVKSKGESKESSPQEGIRTEVSSAIFSGGS